MSDFISKVSLVSYLKRASDATLQAAEADHDAAFACGVMAAAFDEVRREVEAGAIAPALGAEASVVILPLDWKEEHVLGQRHWIAGAWDIEERSESSFNLYGSGSVSGHNSLESAKAKAQGLHEKQILPYLGVKVAS